MKIINIKGIIIILTVLVLIQVSFGFLISPFVKNKILVALSEHTSAKVTVDQMRIWPVTLSCSLKGIKIFDPEDENVRMASVSKASLRIGLLGLLSKRIVITSLNISGAEMNLKGEPDGSFNIQRIAVAEKKSGNVTRKESGLKKDDNKDWFSKIYKIAKNKASKRSQKNESVESKKMTKTAKKIPTQPIGRRVEFNSARKKYLFQIKELNLKNSSFILDLGNSETINISNAGGKIKGLSLDLSQGVSLNQLAIQAIIDKNGISAGEFEVGYSQSFKKSKQIYQYRLLAKNVDLIAIRAIYKDSLPVNFTKGVLDITSQTEIINEELNSNNSITLKEHNLVAKNEKLGSPGMMSLSVICAALNKINPAEMKFDITGTIDNPKFDGFQDVLKDLAKKQLKDVMENINKEGAGALSDFLNKPLAEETEKDNTSKEKPEDKFNAIKSFLSK